ncbi:nuclear transport factor 2 family protein [Pseudomaricurvus alkylphenolicus]|jgi:ketosteroid isomerase-like protein|uniref:nuclear transport factor 2 family protein n=1 Tax=Pseudomaricurvus alkylphenolicus TaxID=1306991 RepID=UPI0014215E46|nr:nuclear transport factor 2 family protein [Pseudomaricurvus alkylphenolicus]NIB40457.1 nuclear transport factor 2 family protein [Pseudomaricurvus alkylphenolicus]
MKILKSALRLASAFCLSVSLSACAGVNELESFKQQIREKYDMKEQAFHNNDPEPILTRFYLDQVVSTDPEGHTHEGRNELRPVYNEIIGAEVKIKSYKTKVKGDLGWDWVNFYVTPPKESGMQPFVFKMLFLWERIDGEWWSHGEMYVPGEFDVASR